MPKRNERIKKFLNQLNEVVVDLKRQNKNPEFRFRVDLMVIFKHVIVT